MSTGNKKRCSAEDERCPQDSNQNSPGFGNNAEDVGDMVTMYHAGLSGGLRDDGQQTKYLQVAWLLREKLSALVDGEKGAFPELGLRSLLDMAASRNIVSVDPTMLNPVLWRTLPKELQLLVFARLPVRDIFRLRGLSREWRRDMAIVNSVINQACDEASPPMVAGISRRGIMLEGYPFPEFLVTICTQSSQYSYRLLPGNSTPGENRWDNMGAHDGGLVCLVSTWKPSKEMPLRIVVVNLLTRIQRILPPLQYGYSTLPKMMHIEVDSETKNYRVVVVGKHVKGRPTVEIYDSFAGQWTKATPSDGYIFGGAHKWEYFDRYWSFRSTSQTQSVYDYPEGQLKSPQEKCLSLSYQWRNRTLVSFWEDCKFVLDRSISDYGGLFLGAGHSITKYRMQNNGENWVKERSYLCSPFEALLGKDYLRQWTLRACEGLVMVFPYSRLSSDGHCGHFWLLDLATGEWSSRPNCFQRHYHDDFFISRAFWNVKP